MTRRIFLSGLTAIGVIATTSALEHDAHAQDCAVYCVGPRNSTVSLGTNSEICNATSAGRALYIAADAGADPEAGEAGAFLNASVPLQGVWGTGLGLSVYVNTTDETFLYFGDANTDPNNPYAWANGADPVGYFTGEDPRTLCSTMTLLAEPTSPIGYNTDAGLEAGLGVFSPDWLLPPSWDDAGINDFIFRHDTMKPDAGYFAITEAGTSPGIDYVPGVDEALCANVG